MNLNKKNAIVTEYFQNERNYSAALKKYYKRLKRGPMSGNGLKNMISKFEEHGELGVILRTRGRHSVNPRKSATN